MKYFKALEEKQDVCAHTTTTPADVTAMKLRPRKRAASLKIHVRGYTKRARRTPKIIITPPCTPRALRAIIIVDAPRLYRRTLFEYDMHNASYTSSDNGCVTRSEGESLTVMHITSSNQREVMRSRISVINVLCSAGGVCVVAPPTSVPPCVLDALKRSVAAGDGNHLFHSLEAGEHVLHLRQARAKRADSVITEAYQRPRRQQGESDEGLIPLVDMNVYCELSGRRRIGLVYGQGISMTLRDAEDEYWHASCHLEDGSCDACNQMNAWLGDATKVSAALRFYVPRAHHGRLQIFEFRRRSCDWAVLDVSHQAHVSGSPRAPPPPPHARATHHSQELHFVSFEQHEALSTHSTHNETERLILECESVCRSQRALHATFRRKTRSFIRSLSLKSTTPTQRCVVRKLHALLVRLKWGSRDTDALQRIQAPDLWNTRSVLWRLIIDDTVAALLSDCVHPHSNPTLRAAVAQFITTGSTKLEWNELCSTHIKYGRELSLHGARLIESTLGVVTEGARHRHLKFLKTYFSSENTAASVALASHVEQVCSIECEQQLTKSHLWRVVECARKVGVAHIVSKIMEDVSAFDGEDERVRQVLDALNGECVTPQQRVKFASYLFSGDATLGTVIKYKK